MATELLDEFIDRCAFRMPRLQALVIGGQPWFIGVGVGRGCRPARTRSCASTGRLRYHEVISERDGLWPVWYRICSASLMPKVPSNVSAAKPAAEWRSSVTGGSPRQHEQSRAGGDVSCERVTCGGSPSGRVSDFIQPQRSWSRPRPRIDSLDG